MDTARYVVGVLLVVVLPPAVIWWFLVHPFVDFWRRLGHRFTLAMMIAVAVAGAAALWPLRHALLGRDLGTSPVTVSVAVVLLAVSIRIALLRRPHLTTRILAGVPELEADGKGGVLLTEGIYARMRHPRYVEVAVGSLAYAFFSNYAGAYVVALLLLPALHLIVVLEERELLDRFGDEYEAYRQAVPRYLPRRS